MKKNKPIWRTGAATNKVVMARTNLVVMARNSGSPIKKLVMARTKFSCHGPQKRATQVVPHRRRRKNKADVRDSGAALVV